MLQPSNPPAVKTGRGERVYFIEAVGLDLIKVGFARDIHERIRQLQPGCPAPLLLLGTVPGGLQIERHYHERLSACHAYGEWFRRGPDLDGVIARLDKPTLRPKRRVSQAIMVQRTREYEERCTRLFKQWGAEKQQKRDAQDARRRERLAAKATASPPEQIAARV